jgi:O-antigen/teichoic acid export membrane protein
MGIIIRQSIKTSLIAYVGVVIGAVNLIWLFPKYLSAEELGIFKFIQDTAFMMALFAQVGASSIIDRFFARFKQEPEKHSGFIAFILMYSWVAFFAFSLLFIGFRDFWLSFFIDNAPGIAEHFYWLLPLTLFMIYQNMFEAYARAHLRIVIPAFLREVYLRLAATLVVVLYFTSLIDFNQLIFIFIIGYGFTNILLFGYIFRLGVIPRFKDISLPDRDAVKQILTYSAFILVGGGAAIIGTRIDSLMIASMVGAEALGIFSIPFFMASVIEMPRRAIGQISLPIIAQALLDKDLPKIGFLYSRTAINQLIIGAFLFLGIWCNINDIFQVVPNTETYIQGKWVFLFIALGRVFDMATGVNSEIISQSKYFRFNTIAVGVMAILIIITNLIFIPVYGINGAALATTLSIVIFNLLKWGFIWNKFGLQPFNKSFLLVLAIIAATYALAIWLPLPDAVTVGQAFINILIRGVVITLVYLGAMYMSKVSPEGNKVAEDLLLKIRKK